ncbi:putative transporter [Triangularia verruculosa]|uniref:Transporter n=1 Tax=Triangularia verruculosa TaxID=2587418 RepID=A0AAN6XFQ6_9PEZI|nr:putative transporter [Triangularia verruculosa]
MKEDSADSGALSDHTASRKILIPSDSPPILAQRENTSAAMTANPNGKTLWQQLLPVVACGAGLFSDGYINNVIGSVVTVLAIQYGDIWANSTAKTCLGAIAFVGTVVGQLLFGTGTYYKGDAVGMFNVLTVWRFFVGIGIGGEYPAGSVAAAEQSGELKKGTRNMWFIWFTNSMIDWGFVIGAFVPWLVAAAAHNTNYETIWRTSLGIGVVFPLSLFVLRFFIKEPEEFQKHSMKYARTPYKLVFQLYGWRLFIVSFIWFLYDFSAYSFSIYSSTILANIFDSTSAPLTTVFGWNTVINLFYIPGTMIGAPVSDWLGPRKALAVGVLLQGVVGFIMAGCYPSLAQPGLVGAFAVVFGVFQSLGELGPGNNIGVLAAKTCATGVRGQYYGVAAAIGKLGAFVGTYVFPFIVKAGGESKTLSAQYPFYVSSAGCVLSAALCWFGVPEVGQDTIQDEDVRFKAFLEANGYDTAQLGLRKDGSVLVEEPK